MILTAIIEMPQNSIFKYELNKVTNRLKLDRTLNQPVPYSYGFVPDTLCEDGDPIDLFVLTDEPIYPLTEVSVELVSVIKCLDNGKKDDKLIGVIVGDFPGFKVVGIGDIVRYLETYKTGFEVLEVGSEEEAIKVYEESVKMYREEQSNNIKKMLDYMYQMGSVTNKECK